METLSEKKDKKLKDQLKDKFSVHTSWGANRADYPETLTFYWPYDREEYRDRTRSTARFVEKLKVEKIYAVAFERDQYAGYEKNFEEKYDNKSVELSASELKEIAEDLVEFMVVPESFEWMIIFDHEGDISFNGNQKFIKKVKNFFNDWEKLSEVPEKRKF